jgi:hypothetical protein
MPERPNIWLLWCDGEVIGAFPRHEDAVKGLNLCESMDFGQDHTWSIGPVPIYEGVQEDA